MGRDIKFRAWDGSRMIYFNQFQISNTGGFWGGTREVWSMQSYYGVGECEGFGFYHDDFAENVELELMQYTGLKDKNGVEIYEGDIVDTHPFHIRSHRKHRFQEVIFDNGFFLAEKSDFGWEGENLVDLNHCIVVGNIYQKEINEIVVIDPETAKPE